MIFNVLDKGYVSYQLIFISVYYDVWYVRRVLIKMRDRPALTNILNLLSNEKHIITTYQFLYISIQNRLNNIDTNYDFNIRFGFIFMKSLLDIFGWPSYVVNRNFEGNNFCLYKVNETLLVFIDPPIQPQILPFSTDTILR